jgi:uncharacterized protein (TIGR00730 family)
MTENERDQLVAAIVASPTYRLAQDDDDFIRSSAARGARLELEMMRPELHLERLNINSTVVVFGSARILPPDLAQAQVDTLQSQLSSPPSEAQRKQLQTAQRQLKYSRYYTEAQQLAAKLSAVGQCEQRRDWVIVTGGGPGIMEAANRGAHDVGACSVGFNIHLPREQKPNPYITPELAFRFHYFAMRKMHFMLRAQALVAFPGGYGTLDELFEALTLVQTGKMRRIPIVLVGREYWEKAVNFDLLVEEGFIDPADRALTTVVDTGDEAAECILSFYRSAPATSALREVGAKPAAESGQDR